PVLTLLAELGFKKRAGYTFTLDVAPGVLGVLGFNQATKHLGPGEVEINPIVGARFQEVERLVAECRGDKFHGYLPATVASPLGYLMPEKTYVAWMFGPESPEEVASDMVDAIATHGIPFMRSVVNLDDLRRLQDRYGIDYQLPYRTSAAALLAGDVEQARALLDNALADIGLATDLAAARFRGFAESLRDRLPRP